MNTSQTKTMMLEEVTAGQLLEALTQWQEGGTLPEEITLLTTTDEGFWTFRGSGVETLIHALEAIGYAQKASEPVAQTDLYTAEERAVLAVLDLLGVNRMTVSGAVYLELDLETLLATMTRHMTWAVAKQAAATRLTTLLAHVGQMVTITTAMESLLCTRRSGLLQRDDGDDDGCFLVVDATKPDVILAQFTARDVRKIERTDVELVVYLPRIIGWNHSL
jgi:hypothetical protein